MHCGKIIMCIYIRCTVEPPYNGHPGELNCGRYTGVALIERFTIVYSDSEFIPDLSYWR